MSETPYRGPEAVEINFRPLGSKVLLQRCKSAVEERGIIIPERHRKPSVECEVHAVGPDVREVKVDDRVMIGVWSGQEVKIGGIPLLVIEEEMIQLVVTDDDAPGPGFIVGKGSAS